jgi:hypothetical protein
MERILGIVLALTMPESARHLGAWSAIGSNRNETPRISKEKSAFRRQLAGHCSASLGTHPVDST